MRIVKDVVMSDEDADLYNQYLVEAERNDRLQYCYKIKLNS